MAQVCSVNRQMARRAEYAASNPSSRIAPGRRPGGILLPREPDIARLSVVMIQPLLCRVEILPQLLNREHLGQYRAGSPEKLVQGAAVQ